MHQILDLHATMTVIIVVITVFVFALMGIISVRFHHKRNPVAQQ